MTGTVILIKEIWVTVAARHAVDGMDTRLDPMGSFWAVSVIAIHNNIPMNDGR